MATSLSAKCVINESGLSILPSRGRKWDVKRYLPYFGARFRDFFCVAEKEGAAVTVAGVKVFMGH